MKPGNSREKEIPDAKEIRSKFRTRQEKFALVFTLVFAAPILYLHLAKPVAKLSKGDPRVFLLVAMICIFGHIYYGLSASFWLLNTRKKVFTKKHLRHRWMGALGASIAIVSILAEIYYIAQLVIKFD